MFSTPERRPGCPLSRRGRAALGSHPRSAGQVSAARGAASPIGADGGWRGKREGGGEWSRCPDPIAGERTSSPGEAQGCEREAERRCAKGTGGAAGRARMSASPRLGRPRLGVVLRASGATGERRSTRGAQGGCSRTCCWTWRRGRGRQGVRPARRVAPNPAELRLIPQSCPRPLCPGLRRGGERSVPASRPFRSSLISRNVRSGKEQRENFPFLSFFLFETRTLALILKSLLGK